MDSFVFEDASNRRPDLGLSLREEPLTAFEDRHLGPEAPEHLPEFEGDVPAPDEDDSAR